MLSSAEAEEFGKQRQGSTEAAKVETIRRLVEIGLKAKGK